MFDVFIQRNLFAQLILVAVDADAHIAAPLCLFEHLLVSALLASHHGRQNLHTGLLRQGKQLIHHLVYGLALHLPPAVRAVRDTDARVQETQVVVDFGHGAHGGTRIPVRALLVNRNRGGESFYALHLRLLHLAEELSRIARERLHVSPLSLGVNRIKGQARLTRAREAGQNHKLISRDVDVHML